MKKLIFLLVLSVISFSNCKYVSDPNADLRTFIEVIKEEKLENKIYCDEDNVKMIYYLNNNKNINIGFVYKVKNLDWVTPEELGKSMKQFGEDVSKILDNKKLRSKKYSNEAYARMYLEDKEGYYLMILRMPLTTREEVRIDYNSDLSDWGFQDMDFYPTNDIVY